MAQIGAVFAELERGLIAERTSEALRLVALLYDIDSGNRSEVPGVGCDDAPSKAYGRGGDEAVVGADVSACRCQFGPDARVDACGT